MMTLGNGATQAVQTQIAGLGSNLHHRRDGAARDLWRRRGHQRPGRIPAYQAVLLRGHRHTRIKGPGGDG
ncbi:hypothetical protein [Lamprocystis purpurea]|uniref:hypothetical protein n=1 Tax=Lamprocystis purpurea TaxID=61598 RepID=UPI00389922B3